MGFFTRPSQTTKKWIVNYANEFLGDIIRAFNIDLFSKKGFVKTGEKVYPHTTQADITGLKPVTAFCKANIDDGDAGEREKKLWAVSENKVLKMEDSDFAFEEDESEGLENDTFGEDNDLISVGDEANEDGILTTPVNIVTGTSIDFSIQLDTDKFAQSFLATGDFSMVGFEVKKDTSPSDNFVVSIQEDYEGSPSGVNLATYSMAGTDLTTAYVAKTVTLEDFNLTELNLDTEKTYWLVFSRDGSTDVSNFYKINVLYSTLSEVYDRGKVKFYDGTNWNEMDYTDSTEFLFPSANGAVYTDWTNPSNAHSSNNSYATHLGIDGGKQDYYTFGAAVPTGAIIRGIEVKAEAKVSAGSGYINTWLSKGGTESSFRYALINTVEAEYTMGGPNDMWGLTLTPADVNSPGFGVIIRANDNSITYSLDCLSLKIYYQVPGEDPLRYIAIKSSVSTEFPGAEERLYLTTKKDVKFLGEDNGFWYSLWRGILQQDELDPEYPAILKDMGSGGTLILGNGNKVHTMTATATTPTEASVNRLIFDSTHFVNWIRVTSSSVFIGLQHKDGELLPSQVIHYEPYAERTRIFVIEEGATMGFILNENCHIIDKSGQIRYFTGASFTPYQYFPCYDRKEKITTLPHRNGIVVKHGIVKILWEGQYPDPAGVWVLENGNLYHKDSLVFDKVNLNSLGALETEKLGALFEEEDIYLGASVLDGAGNEVQGIYATAKEENVSVDEEQRAVIVTSKFSGNQLDEVWQDLAVKYLPEEDGEIYIKQKTEPDRVVEGSGAVAFNGIWTNSTTFTCADADFDTKITAGDIKVGDEIIIRKGQGAGLLAHITAISASPRTITIDEGLSAISSGTFTFSVEAWKKIKFETKETKFSHRATLKDDRLEWKQFKISIKNHAVEEVQLLSTTDKTLIKR
jgi:hypothetical protein